jgi:predicted DCC family thiol-disulfide oxidoreductase YuxK
VANERHSSTPVLYYDGSCGFCDATVQFVLRHDRSRVLRFAPLQGAHAAALLRHNEELATVDSVIWLEGNQLPGTGPIALVRSDAVLRIARYLGFPWSLLLIGRVIPRALRDWLYDIVARHRKRIMRTPAACDIPTPSVRARFLD